jgi:hypothetical protein
MAIGIVGLSENQSAETRKKPGAFLAGRRPTNQLCITINQTSYEITHFHSLPRRGGFDSRPQHPLKDFLQAFYLVMTTVCLHQC